MSQEEMLRFDRSELEQHADEYCSRETKLANELFELLRLAAYFAPAGSRYRVIQLMNDADRLARYFPAMHDALYEAGALVDETSGAVLERLEDSTSEIKRLLK